MDVVPLSITQSHSSASLITKMSIPSPILLLSLAMMNSRSTSGGTTLPVTIISKVVSVAQIVKVFPITGRFRTHGANTGVTKASSVLKSLMDRVSVVWTESLNSSTSNTEHKMTYVT